MISTLHSIDVLLNHFDELSKCHQDLLTNFELNITDIVNPLKIIEKISLSETNTTEQSNSLGILSDFHRRVIVNRHLHRPPKYKFNENSFNKRFIYQPKPIVRKPPTTVKIDRKMATVFTFETVNRLSKPKRYNRLPELNTYLKRKQQRAKPYEIRQNEAFQRLILTKSEKTKKSSFSNRFNRQKKFLKK